MSIDRITHLVEQMHRSEDDTGDPIDAGMLLAADGARGLEWVDPSSVTGLGSGILTFLDHGTVGATEDIDQSAAAAHWITLDVNCTLTFSGAVATVAGDPVECSFRLYVEQDGSGGNTITWPGSVVWPGGVTPTLDTTASSIEVLDFTTPDGGTVWYGFHGGTGSSTDLSDNDPANVGTAPDPGVGTEASRDDHVHALPESVIEDIGHYELLMTGSGPPEPIENGAGDDWLYVWVPG